ncbi:hypothetical protein G9A89_008313 [Geosiphon pyriformis]|nr:hypothetical protein G9A89_008313 [Geosiphon pyriformis]
MAKRQYQTLTTALISAEKKAHICGKCCNQQKTNSVPYNQRTQQVKFTFKNRPSETDNTNMVEKAHSRDTQKIPAETTITESNFCNYINTKINLQQPIESDPEKYKYRFNNPTIVQDKSMVNKKPSWTKSLGEYRLLFENLTSTASQTERNISTWEQPPAQNPTESASPLMERTAILQPISTSNKGKQPALAPREHSNT